MNKLFLVITIVTFCFSAKSQTKALTDEGREVILFENGTWQYLPDSSQALSKNRDSMTLNPLIFSKPKGATFLVKSKTCNVGIYINPSKWTFAGHQDNENTPEYRFNLKSGEGYAMLVTEKTQIGLEAMREIALINAQKAAFDAKETKAEYRMVNGQKVLCLQLNGTIKGLKFVYFGYYYSNDSGTVQLISYSSQKLFDTLQKDMENLLNGLVEIKN